MKTIQKIEDRIIKLEQERHQLAHSMENNSDLEKSPYMRALVEEFDSKLRELKWVLEDC